MHTTGPAYFGTVKPLLPRLLCVLVLSQCHLLAENWPAWRGPTGMGVCHEKGLPITWTKNDHVKWRIPLPERGHSTPVVWEERIFITQAVGEQRTLMCLSRNEGKLLWQSAVTTKGKEPTHATNPYCSASPVTDGERVIVSFASDGLYCYDFEGKEIWRRTDLGNQIHIWGNASSPVIAGELCFLNFGPGETTYLLAVEKRTGKTVWQHQEEPSGGKSPGTNNGAAANPNFIGSWTTPVLTTVEGNMQLLMSWPGRLAAYEPNSGKELWRCTGLNPLVYTSPIQSGDTVVAMGGFNGMAIGVRAGGTGDITETRRLWHHPKSPQRIGSGVMHEGRIFIHNDPGTAMCIDAKSGETLWTERLKGAGKTGVNWSSVLLADGNCYTITQGGDCFVFKAGPTFELLSVNSLGEASNASLAASNGELFIRTHEALWCIK